MSNSKLTIKVPGKLMIAGEYAVLTTGYPAIVMAVNRFIYIHISPSDHFMLSDPSSNEKITTWTLDNKGGVMGLNGDDYTFIKEAITVCNQYLIEERVLIRPCHIEIENGLLDSKTGMKYGLGSSAAIVAGIISAILSFHSQDLENIKLKIYKLACIAHLRCQGNGSGADIAASIFGGCLAYYRYDLSWLLQKLKDPGISIASLIEMPWPNLGIEKLELPTNIRICAGWTKQSVKTSPMVDKIESFQRQKGELYEEFLKQSKIAVMEFMKSCKLNYGIGILNAIHLNRMALQYLSQTSKMELETIEIKDLCYIADKYGKSKFSGAGGGDCGIVFFINSDRIEELKSEWKQAGIIPLDLEIAREGAFWDRTF